jgi:hypothetical protein
MTRGDPLKALGAAPETSFSKLVSQCGIIFTMVSPTHGFWLELINYCTKEE